MPASRTMSETVSFSPLVRPKARIAASTRRWRCPSRGSGGRPRARLVGRAGSVTGDHDIARAPCGETPWSERGKRDPRQPQSSGGSASDQAPGRGVAARPGRLPDREKTIAYDGEPERGHGAEPEEEPRAGPLGPPDPGERQPAREGHAE